MIGRRVRRWLRATLFRSRADRDMRDEMQFHIDRRAEQLIAHGMSPDDARTEARRMFGNIAALQERVRDTRPARGLESVAADIRFAFRFFARKPLSSITIVLVLAFGVAGYAAFFTLLQSARMRPPPGMPDDASLVLVRATMREQDRPQWMTTRFSYGALREISELRTIFSSVTGWSENDVVVDAPGALDHKLTRAHFVTDDYFSIIGVRPARGSALPAPPPGAPAESQLVAVISDAMWEDAFGRKEVSDRTMMVNGVRVRIVGVAPAEFNGPLGMSKADGRFLMWLPLRARSAIVATVNGGTSASAVAALSSADSTIFQAMGRLKAGVSPEQATAAVRVVALRAIGQRTPPRVGPNGLRPPVFVYDATVIPFRRWDGAFRAAFGAPESGSGAVFIALGTIATLLLLAVCTNVAALVISAAVGRRQEIAVRLSLGASRVRVIRQLLTENIVLATFGAVLALGVYQGAIVALSRFPQAAFLRADLGTVAFTMVIALGTGILCGLAPALSATRSGVATALKDTSAGATRRSRLQHTFVVAQVMFTQPLLLLIASIITASLMVKKIPLPEGVADHVLRLRVDPRFLPGTWAEGRDAINRTVRRIGEAPGVVNVLPYPVWVGGASLSVHPEDREPNMAAASSVSMYMERVDPGYFDLIGVPLVRGSTAAPASDTGPTMIIGSDVARKLWGNADPIGRRFQQIMPVRTIVVSGVYDARYFYAGDRATVYRPVNNLWSNGEYLIRTTVPALDLAKTIRAIVREELPLAPVSQLITLAQLDAERMATERNIQMGATAGGVLVLLLSSIGLYGAVALAVGQRTREIGIRMALGARAGEVVSLFYARGVRLGIIGMVLGLPVSLVAFHFLGQLDSSGDTAPSLWWFGGVIVATVLAVASVATLIPATRAARVNPVTALRAD